MFKSEKEARAYLAPLLLKEGKFDTTSQDHAISQIVEAIPSATKADYYGDTEIDVVAAANYYETYAALREEESNANTDTGNDKGKEVIKTQTTTPTTPTVKQKADTTYVKPNLSDEAIALAIELVESSMAGKIQATAGTFIKEIIVRNPKSSEMYKGITVIPKCDPSKLAEYEKLLIDTEKNRTDFKEVKEAIGAKAMAIHTNDLQRKMIGIKVSAVTTGAGKTTNQEELLTLAKTVGFLTTRVMGRIPSEKTGLGVKMTGMANVSSSAKKADGTSSQGKPRLKWVGKTEAYKEDKNLLVANEYKLDSKGVKITKEASLRIEKTFEVYASADPTDCNAKGERKTRKIRLRGKSKDIPVMVRNEKLAKIFGAEVEVGVISATFSEEEKKLAVQMQVDLLQAVTGDTIKDASLYGAAFTDIIQTIKNADDTAGKTAADGYED